MKRLLIAVSFVAVTSQIGCQGAYLEPTDLTLDKALINVEDSLQAYYKHAAADPDRKTSGVYLGETTVTLAVTAKKDKSNQLVLVAGITGTNPVANGSATGTFSRTMSNEAVSTITLHFKSVLDMAKDSFGDRKSPAEIQDYVKKLAGEGPVITNIEPTITK